MLTHIDENNNPSMVDVGDKLVTERTASARAIVLLPEEISKLFYNNDIQSKKGPVFNTAIIAGTMGAKKTPDLIPFCHPIGLENCKITIILKNNEVIIDCHTKVTSKTGVEMEALTGASIAALTVYDMCKAMSHNIIIKEIKLIEKKGGKSDFIQK